MGLVQDSTRAVFPSPRRRRLEQHLVPFLVALLIVGLTLAGLVRVLDRDRAADEARFRIEARTVVKTFETRVHYQERLLDAVAGLYAVVEGSHLTPALWYRFVQGLEPLRFSPGVVAIMHIRPPSGTRQTGCTVDRFWPEDVATRVLGRDACHNAHLLPTLVAARVDGGIRASPPFPVWNLQGRPTTGFALVRSIETVQPPFHRLGWAVVILSVPRLARLMGGGRHFLVTLLPPGAGIGYASGALETYSHRAQGLLSTRLRLVRHVLIGGERWEVEMLRTYHAGMLPWILLIGGLAIALLAYFITFLAVRTRERAGEIAERLSARLSRNLELLRSVMNNVSEGIYRSTPDGRIIFCNRALPRLFGYGTLHEFLQVDLERLYVHPERRRELFALLARQKHYERIEIEMTRKDGERFVALESAQATFAPDGELLYVDGVVSDVTHLRAAENRAAYLDQYDKHTGLPNRTLLRDRIHQAVELARHTSALVVVADLDIDRFVAVNELHGQDVGDALLQYLGRGFQDVAQGAVSVGRLGEDEFVAVATISQGNYSEILLFVNRLQTAVAEAYRQYAPDAGGTASVGVSLLPGDAHTEEELLLHAGAALRTAKGRSPGSLVFYSHETHQAALNEIRLVHRLQNLVAKDEFAVAFQPIVDLEERRVVSLETLARWPRDDLPIVSPELFIPLAERHRLIGRIEEVVWRKAFLTWRGWDGESWRPASLSVNISLRHLMESKDFTERFLALLQDTGMPAKSLVIELTETNLLERPDELRDLLRDFTDGGIRVAIDDFGTGYSGLTLLRRLPVSILKLDRSCVDHVADDANAQIIARAVSGLARDLSLELVAEGIERDRDRDVLVAYGYRRFQGFLYSPPLDPVDVPNFVASFAVEAARS